MGGGGLLFRIACSVVLWGGRGTADMSLACVGSTRSVPATLGLPPLMAHMLSPSTLLRLQAALWGVGPELHAVPVFGSSTKAQTQLGLRFVPSPPKQLRQPGA